MKRPKHIPYLDNSQAGLSPDTSHPAYVAAAPEWFWNEDDPRAPFGTDDGHDTLSTLQEHFIQGGTDEHVPGCIASLITDWALVPETVWTSSQEEIVVWLDADENHVRFLHGEIDVYVAAACGQFKTSGWIHPALRFWAERALMLLEHVLGPWEQKTFGAAPGTYDEKLAATRAVIAAAPDPPKKLQLPMYRGL
ncbi:hypothetical protein [Ruania alba]|uniref:Uncharacterized conserved protein YfeS, contains WGR domain n=1 Tax=Ruania alba TaxID=648782 RepID=A0A1H5N7P0_9MICO|nr:hypothetical protein [Ruania alba]SEE96897.1 Uncharacterized conserved protein YfeS, contains WGR domain [Ruania alba]